MTLFPVLGRELQLAVRRPATYYSRSVAVLVVTAASLAMLYAGLGGFMKPAAAGRNLFLMLSLMGYAYVLLEGVLRTADCVSEEKREGTIGLLFLTDLNSAGIVWGKLVARVLPSACSLIAALPALGLATFLGGVTGSEFYQMILALLNALFFASAFGILMSSCFRSDRLSFGLGIFGICTVGVALPVIGHLVQRSSLLPSIPPEFLLSSPGGAVWDLLGIGKDVRLPAAPSPFWRCLLTSHLMAWGFLALASLGLSCTWRAQSGGSYDLWEMVTGLGKRSKGVRAGYRVSCRRWLDDRPMVWIGERKGFEKFAWGGFIALGLVLLGVLWFESSLIANWTVVLILTFILHVFLIMGAVIHTCRGPSDDRRTGVMELLATTPVGPDMIIQGRMLAFKRQALRPFAFVLFIDASVAAIAWWRLDIGPAGAITGALIVLAVKSLADLYVVSWIGFWQGLKARNTTTAVRRTIEYFFLWRWLAVISVVAILGLLTGGSAFRSPSTAVLIGVAYFTVLVMSHWHFCALAQSEVKDELRTLAARHQDEAEMAAMSWTGRFRAWWSDWFTFLQPMVRKQ